MKERPILFSGPMVRAILDGRKTQTRRVVKPQPSDTLALPTGRVWPLRPMKSFPDITRTVRCPYGAAGDRLWVRETWRPARDHLSECTGPSDIRFATSVDETEWAISTWRPSIHMPRWASRITLEVTDVRVDRLQGISEDDAQAEGVVAQLCRSCVQGSNSAGTACQSCDANGIEETAREAYAALWDAINGKRAPWASNPWVWIVDFKRIANTTRAA